MKKIKIYIFVIKIIGFLSIMVDCWKDKSSLCYQCVSKTTDDNQDCSSSNFKFLNHTQLDDYTFHCSRRLSDYCFLMEENVKGVQITTRGCIGPTDSQGRELGVGCATLSNGVICFCSEDLCNHTNKIASALSQLKMLLVFFILSL